MGRLTQEPQPFSMKSSGNGLKLILDSYNRGIFQPHIALAALAIVPAVSLGQLKVAPRADVWFQDSSNVFDLANGVAPPNHNAGRTCPFRQAQR